MIETIYRNDRNEKGGPDINIRLPKNFKQIGQSDSMASCQIYIEENVISFIKQPTRDEERIRYGVFLGDIKKGNGYTYVFINGVIEVEEMLESTIIFSEEVWTSIYDNIKRYYKEGMVVGWYCSFESENDMDMQRIRKIHLDHFAGNHRVFLGVDRQEEDEAFYIYEGNGLMKQSCYHVYFEKSEAFEDYLFATGRQERDIKVKETRAERGKYGIALNNNIGKKEEPVKDIAKFNLSKVASWGTILALTGVLTAMGLNGDLDALGQGVKGLADNVMNRESNEPSLDNIISINGSPSNKIGQDESASVNADVTSSKENSTAEENEATTENENSETSENSTEDSTSTEIEDEEEVVAENESSSQENDNSGGNEEETTEESEETNISGNKTVYKTYIVEKGDTLYSIAMELYKDADKVKEIVEINNLEDENYVMEGQKIFLP